MTKHRTYVWLEKNFGGLRVNTAYGTMFYTKAVFTKMNI